MKFHIGRCRRRPNLPGFNFCELSVGRSVSICNKSTSTLAPPDGRPTACQVRMNEPECALISRLMVSAAAAQVCGGGVRASLSIYRGWLAGARCRQRYESKRMPTNRVVEPS